LSPGQLGGAESHPLPKRFVKERLPEGSRGLPQRPPGAWEPACPRAPIAAWAPLLLLKGFITKVPEWDPQQKIS